jgi:hypothetical protein
MTQEEKNKQEEKDLLDEMQDEIVDIEDEEGEIDEEKIDEVKQPKPK